LFCRIECCPGHGVAAFHRWFHRWTVPQWSKRWTPSDPKVTTVLVKLLLFKTILFAWRPSCVLVLKNRHREH